MMRTSTIMQCAKHWVKLFACVLLITCSASVYAQLGVQEIRIENFDNGDLITLTDGGEYDITGWDNYYIRVLSEGGIPLRLEITVDDEMVTESVTPYTFPGTGQAFWEPFSGRHTINAKVFASNGDLAEEVTVSVIVNDFLKAPDKFNYEAGDNVIVSIEPVAIDKDGTELAILDNPANIRQVIAEVVYKGGNPGSEIEFEDQDGNVYTAERDQVQNANNAFVYRTSIPGGAEEIIFNESSNTNRLQSFVLNIFRDEVTEQSFYGVFTKQGGFNNIRNFSLDFPELQEAQDVEVTLPLSEITDDGRELRISASSGGVVVDTLINGPGQGSCCLNFLPIVLENVPAGTDEISFSVDSENGGQSWVLAASIFFQQLNTTLPVELVEFNAELDRFGAVELTWVTASEENNDRFEIQRSKDGLNFTTIGGVAGNGTTNDRSYYSYIDTEASSLGSAQLFYRLKQIDLDLVSEFSPIRLVNIEGSGKKGDVDLIMTDAGRGYRLVDNSGEGISLVQVYSIEGNLVSVLEFEKESVIDFSGRDLTSGTYVLVLDNTYSRKVAIY